MNKVVCDKSSQECRIHRCEKCPGTGALKAFLDDELEEFEPDSEFHYSQWQTTDRAALVTLTTTCEEFNYTTVKLYSSW